MGRAGPNHYHRTLICRMAVFPSVHGILGYSIPTLVSQFASVPKRIKVLSGTKPPPIPVTLKYALLN